MKDVRNILMEEMNSLISGKTDIKRARAISKLSAQVIYKDRLSMEEKVYQLANRKYIGK